MRKSAVGDGGGKAPGRCGSDFQRVNSRRLDCGPKFGERFCTVELTLRGLPQNIFPGNFLPTACASLELTKSTKQ